MTPRPGQRLVLANALARIQVDRCANARMWAQNLHGGPVTDEQVIDWILRFSSNLPRVCRDVTKSLGESCFHAILRRRALQLVADNHPELARTAQAMADDLDPDVVIDRALDRLDVAVRIDPQSLAMDRANADRMRRGLAPLPMSQATLEFIERVTVNFIRHELSNYDQTLAWLVGQLGHGCETPVKVRIFELISEAYPHLAAECDRQSRARIDEDLALA